MKIALIGRDAHRVLAFRGSFIRAAQARGHEVIAITGYTTRESQDALEAASVRWFGAPLEGGSMNPLKDFAYARAVRRILQAEQIEAVFAYNPKPLAHASGAARKAGVRRVVGMVTGLGHGFIGESWREGLVRTAKISLYRRAFAACDVVLVQNADDRAQLERAGAITPALQSRVRNVPGSGVDLVAFPQVDVPPVAHFLMVARPLREKGLPEYFAAAHLVKHALPSATFTWIGPLRDTNPSAIDLRELQRWLAEGVVKHVEEQVHIQPWLAACSVFVLPSHREGTSKVVLEALATGRAVITTNAPGCRETVRHDTNGLLVPVLDAMALAAAMQSIAGDVVTMRAFGNESRKLAETVFDAKVCDEIVLCALEGK